MPGIDSEQRKWDQRYRDQAPGPPMVLLSEFAYLLPANGKALDLASGLGGNALFLAARGLTTEAWDLSAVAVERLELAAANLPLRARRRDVVMQPPAPESFDVICVAHFLDRGLCPAIAAALRPGGLLFYQTFSRERVDVSGPSTDRYRLDRNELLRLFDGLLVRFYRDEGCVGDTARGVRNVAQLIAQVPFDRSL